MNVVPCMQRSCWGSTKGVGYDGVNGIKDGKDAARNDSNDAEDELSHTNGRTQSETLKIPERAAADVERRAAENLANATPRAPLLLDIMEKPKNGPLGRYRHDVED